MLSCHLGGTLRELLSQKRLLPTSKYILCFFPAQPPDRPP